MNELSTSAIFYSPTIKQREKWEKEIPDKVTEVRESMLKAARTLGISL